METQIKKLTNIQLTGTEIDLVIEALDNLPSKNLASNMMMDMLSMSMGGEDDKEKIKSDMKQRGDDMRNESDKIKNDIEIVKAKIILAKAQTDN